MEEIRDRELNVVGERYRSFLEFYRVNDYRPLNALYTEEGDGVADGLFEVDAGVMFSPEDTREALLYGTNMYHERFEQAKVGAQRILRDKYEWLAEERFESDTHGQNVIVERHVLGHPKSFSRRRPNMTKKRSVRILYDAMCPASTPLETRIEAGCAVLAAADALEQVGYEVALSFVLAKYSGSNVKGDATLVLDIPLKGFGERILPAKTEFALASKSMLFHVGCWWAHRFPRTPVNYGPGEGYPLSYDKGRLAAMRAYAERHHGVYVSEDVVEVQLGSDPVQVLEHVIERLGEECELLAHLRGASRLAAGVEPDQGKLFPSFQVGNDGESEISPLGAAPLGRNDVEEASSDSSRDDVEGGFEDSSQAERAGGERSREISHDASDDEGATEDEVSPLGAAPLGRNDVEGTSSEPGRNGVGGTSSDAGRNDVEGASSDSSRDDAEGGFEDSFRAGGEANPDGRSRGSEQGSPEGEKGIVPNASEGPSESGEMRSGDQDTPEGKASENEDNDSVTSGNEADSDEKSDKEGEGMGMADKNENGGLDFAQITKALEDDMVDADPAMPQSAEDFVMMLRRRYMMFEQGDYLNMMIGEKMAKRKAGKAAKSQEAPLSAPPVPVDAPTLDNVQFGAPRNTPFSMTSIPHKKN